MDWLICWHTFNRIAFHFAIAIKIQNFVDLGYDLLLKFFRSASISNWSQFLDVDEVREKISSLGAK